MSPPGRIATIEAFKAEGGGVAAVYPVRAPRGLLRGYGLLPVEVWGPPRADTTRGSAYIQAYVCSIVRCGLSWLLEDGLRLADVIVAPHACDALQGLGSLLVDFHAPPQPVWPLYLPRAPGPAAQRYLERELRAGAALLAEATGRQPDDAELLEAITREEAADASLGELLAARTELPLSNRAFWTLARTREYLPAEQFTALAREALDQRGAPPEADGVPVVLSGIVPEPMDVLDALSDAGALVVADDLACCGRRVLPAGTSRDPFERSAERLLGGPACSTLGRPAEARSQHLLGLCRRSDARAVVFFVPRSCEPEQFYRPILQREVRAAGLRELSVEVDIDQPLSQQTVTRLEALVEATMGGVP